MWSRNHRKKLPCVLCTNIDYFPLVDYLRVKLHVLESYGVLYFKLSVIFCQNLNKTTPFVCFVGTENINKAV